MFFWHHSSHHHVYLFSIFHKTQNEMLGRMFEPLFSMQWKWMVIYTAKKFDYIICNPPTFESYVGEEDEEEPSLFLTKI